MKIAVYGVARNEAKNIEQWFLSSKDADFHLILDTGSTDNSVDIAKGLGIDVHEAFFSPWDESMAKNVALSLLPKDIDVCILLDLDQVIYTKNWKQVLTESLMGKSYNIIQHDFIDQVDFINEDANRLVVQNIHSRKNCYWHRYRPRLETIIKTGLDYTIYVPVIIRHMPGNEERYVDRESVYLDSWEVEYQKVSYFLNTYQGITAIRYLLEIVAHQAFNFFETDNLHSFFEKEKEYWRLRDQYVSTLESDHIVSDMLTIYTYDSQFMFANSLIYPENAEKYLNSVNENSWYSFNANLKLDIIKFWKNGTMSENIKNLTDFEKIVAYGDSKTGRHKIELSKNSYKYFTGKEYSNEN